MILTVIIVLCFLVYAIFAPPLFFRIGMIWVEKTEKIADGTVFHIPKPKKKPKMTAEEDRMTQILRNIDNYNGTPQGQVKVEVKHD